MANADEIAKELQYNTTMLRYGMMTVLDWILDMPECPEAVKKQVTHNLRRITLHLAGSAARVLVSTATNGKGA